MGAEPAARGALALISKKVSRWVANPAKTTHEFCGPRRHLVNIFAPTQELPICVVSRRPSPIFASVEEGITMWSPLLLLLRLLLRFTIWRSSNLHRGHLGSLLMLSFWLIFCYFSFSFSLVVASNGIFPFILLTLSFSHIQVNRWLYDGGILWCIIMFFCILNDYWSRSCLVSPTSFCNHLFRNSLSDFKCREVSFGGLLYYLLWLISCICLH